MDIRDQLEAAKAEVARLERMIAARPCAEVGHRWRSRGGCNACCHKDCGCSVPVNFCTICGDCDYGDNAEALQVRADCTDKYGPPHERFGVDQQSQGEAK